jgi:hypothetical protein
MSKDLVPTKLFIKILKLLFWALVDFDGYQILVHSDLTLVEITTQEMKVDFYSIAMTFVVFYEVFKA